MADTKVVDEVVGGSPDVLREQALRRLKKRRDFRSHAFAYVAVNVVLWVAWTINGVASDSWDPWPLWVTLIWGLALVFEAWEVFVRRPITEDEIRSEMDRLTRRP